MKYTTEVASYSPCILGENESQTLLSSPLKFPAISTVPPRQQDATNICFPRVLVMESVNLQDLFCWGAMAAWVKGCFWQRWLNVLSIESLETPPEHSSLFTTPLLLRAGCQEGELPFCLTTGIVWSTVIRLEYGYDSFEIFFKYKPVYIKNLQVSATKALLSSALSLHRVELKVH